jgi:elongation factor Ts
MNITAEAVKQLRERTGAGMMECKKALVEAKGDPDVAAENMRKAGLAKADKKAARVAAEGVVVVEKSEDGKTGVLVEVNSETDFVARGDEFRGFASEVAKAALAARAADIDTLNATRLASGETVDEKRRALIAKIGENLTVRRVALVSAARTCTPTATRPRWWRSRAATPNWPATWPCRWSHPARATSLRPTRRPSSWPRSARSRPSR